MTTLTPQAPLCANPRCRKPLRKRTDRPGWAHVGGNCLACHSRMTRAGAPSSAIPDPVPRAVYTSRARAASAARRREDRDARLLGFARLRARRVPVDVAGRRVGVTPDTARRYEAELRRNARAAA